MKNKSSKEISDIVAYNIKKRNDIKFWDLNMLFEDLELEWDMKKVVRVLDVLKFLKVIKYNGSCWENMYF